jgi:hypothetical protein
MGRHIGNGVERGLRWSHLRRWGIPGVAALLICLPVAWFAATSLASHDQNAVTVAALRYAQGQIVWTKGPEVRSAHTVRLRELRSALHAYAPGRVGRDVNVGALIRQYGPNFRVGLVLLSGDFNSLPPDEGVTLHDVVVLVAIRSNTAFFLTD